MASTRQLGPYEIVREIGRGGMGVVYLARDSRLDRLVAIKSLPEQIAADPARLAMLRNEARTIAQLNHPHIAQIHQLLEHEGGTYLVLEYVPGRSLTDVIRAALKPTDAIRICAQIARAVEAAHAKGVIHRDLKPENIRVTEEGTAKVLDFGIAMAAPQDDPDAPTRPAAGIASAGAGTPGYMAPEQARAKGVDHRADIFSFGCVLFECLTARPAIPGESSADRIALTLTGTVDLSVLPPGVPRAVHDLLRRCLDRDIETRLHSIADARVILDESLGRQTAVAPEPRGVDVPTNLPRPRDQFVGREDQIAQLVDLLDSTRLLTLAGSGGCGKTRLAIELSRRHRARFPGGVYFVELASTDDPSLVPSAVLSSIGAKEKPGTSVKQSILDAIGNRQVLLVLDNCEHVIEPVGAAANDLLDACPELRIIATSREALGVHGERAWRVPSLSVPPADPGTIRRGDTTRGTPHTGFGASRSLRPDALLGYESVALFVERARAARPAFQLGLDNADAVARICRRVDGIPLAIELAAARVRAMAPEQIADRMEDSFRILAGAGRGTLDRHQTLMATIQWSYDLLSERERLLLQRLSIFVGGWTLEAAERVCADAGGPDAALHEEEILDLLITLVDKSLVEVEDGPDAMPRYRMLEGARQFARDAHARERGVEQVKLRIDRHLDYFLDFAETAKREFAGPNQAAWFDLVEADNDNLLAGVHRGARADAIQRICTAVWMIWNDRGYLRAGLDACLVAARASDVATPARAGALNACAVMSWSIGEMGKARRMFEQALEIRRAVGDRPGIAASLNNLSIVARHEGDLATARSLQQESLDIARELNEPGRVAICLCNLGIIARDAADLDAARDYLEQALAIDTKLGNSSAMARDVGDLGTIARMQRDFDRARECFAQALTLGRDIGDKGRIREMLDHTAVLAARCKDRDAAARFFGAASAMLEQTGAVRPPDTMRDLDDILPAGADAPWAEVEAQGRLLSEPEAITAALAWLGAEDGRTSATQATIDP
jgi:non-specific serine/threonine protein kinase